jgi:hypothetical protein
MAKCDYCGSTIIIGGKRDNNGRFCNQKCQSRGTLLAFSRQIPEASVQEQVLKMHQGACPKCNGSGPVDVHVSHKVWSALLLTSWSSKPELCCRSCGTKSQLAGASFSLVLGWWGFPWGLLLTPIQIGRNLYGMARQSDPSKASPQLEKLVRMNLAATALQQQQAKAATASSQIP